ncbi:MAG: hypothetical protein ACRDKX_06265 [Solirubrobacterales bacterium]
MSAIVGLRRRLANLLEHPEELADATHEQPLLVDLGPRAGRNRDVSCRSPDYGGGDRSIR